MKLTVLFLACLIGAVAWFTHEPVREELAMPMEVIGNATANVAEASSVTPAEALAAVPSEEPAKSGE